MIAEKKLVPQGKIKLMINDDEEKSPEIGAGGNLLTELSNQKIFLPSACGGGGTCGMCKFVMLDEKEDPCNRCRGPNKLSLTCWKIAPHRKIKIEISNQRIEQLEFMVLQMQEQFKELGFIFEKRFATIDNKGSTESLFLSSTILFSHS